MELTHLIDALRDPAAYAGPVDGIEFRQTHISLVFLLRDVVYKIKKPVDLGFVDFSTLQKRLHFCQEEVRLNRRLAPEVYLGVVPVAQRGNGVRVEGEGELIEWAVKMQRLPESATLRERLARKEVGVEAVEVLARKIAGFHEAAISGEAISAFGRFDAVARNLRDIFQQSVPHIGTTVSRTVFERLETLTEYDLARHRELIEDRARRGVTRDCHGDLHLDHIYLFPEKQPPSDLQIIDCIEFNERFRFIDPVADMAFLAMALKFRGYRDLADAFTSAYFAATGDEEGRALLPMYVTYRATVRGSVEGMKLAETEVTEADRAATLEKARAHWLLALAEREGPKRKPCLILVAGLPGTGKSSLAHALAERADFQVIRSDVVRKELAAAELRGDLYTPEMSDHTYAECLRRATELLFEGKRVLVDANFRKESQRELFLEGAVRWGVPAALLHCHADRETVRQRLTSRRGDASDADWLVYSKLAAEWEEPGPSTRHAVRPIETGGSVEQSLQQALEALPEIGLN